MGAMGPQEIAEGRYSSDIDAHEHAMSLRIGPVVEQLEDLLGATAVAAIGGGERNTCCGPVDARGAANRSDPMSYASLYKLRR